MPLPYRPRTTITQPSEIERAEVLISIHGRDVIADHAHLGAYELQAVLAGKPVRAILRTNLLHTLAALESQ
jgi:hypothetical protein